MNTSQSVKALRRANPRSKAGFAESVEAAADAVRAQVVTSVADTYTPPVNRGPNPARRLVRISAAGACLAVAAAATALTIGAPGGGPGVEDATAAVKRAALVTAASAERSGTAVVRITHDGEVWAAKTIRWHEGDLEVSRDAPQHFRKAGVEFLVVGGTLYGIDPAVGGGWIELGSPATVDPGSGTTPAEYLAAVRADISGVTLRRITDAMSGLTKRRLGDGSALYSGTVAAGLIARESGFKESQAIRVLPFGYVAHEEAADPSAPVATTVNVGPDGIVREIAVTWGTSASAWTYTVTYTELGTTPALVAPADVRSLKDRTPSGPPRTGLGGSD